MEDAGPTEFRKSKVIKDVKEQDVIDKLDAEKVITVLFTLPGTCSGSFSS